MNYWTNSCGRRCEDLLYVITAQLLQPYYRCPRIPTFPTPCFFSPTKTPHICPIRINVFFSPRRRVPLSLLNKNHIGHKWKKKARDFEEM